jgi:hypothetical protein
LSDDITPEGVIGITDVKNFGYAVILAVAGFTGTINGFDDLWKFPVKPGEASLRIAAIALFLTLAVLVVRWVIVTQHQLEMWKKWLDHPIAPAETYTAFCGLSLMLGILPVFAHRVVAMTSIMTVYLGINYWTQWLCNVHFARALAKSRENPLTPLRIEVHRAMEFFWVTQPQLPRILFMLLACVVAFFLAVAGAYDVYARQTKYYLAAYVVLILDIIISELVIARWRVKLDAAIATAVMQARKERYVGQS